MEKSLTYDDVRPENHYDRCTINSNLSLKQESKEERIKNHLTPIKTGIDLVLAGKMGEIPATQKNNFELMRSELESITNLLGTSQDKTIPKQAEYEFRPQEQKIELSKNDFHANTEIINIHKRFAGKNQILTLMVLTGLIILAGTNLAHSENIFESSNDPIQPKSKYLIQNLRGDKIDTWHHWKIPEDRTLYVSIQNPNLVSQEKLELIKDVVLSEERISIDDYLQHKAPRGFKSEYYLGWAGALEDARKESTLYNIPDIKIIESSESYKADIIISLFNHRDSDGYSGYTNSIVEGNQILKSNITIYQANELSENGLETIVRHEFGHALGLAHSTAPEDLMAPIVTTPYPFVSECDVDAIVSLYNGNELSQVVCEK